MGDVFKDIKYSVILNRSLVEGGVNRAQTIAGKNSADALKELAAAVVKSGNKEAGELLDQFNEELTRSSPRKGLLKRSWDSLIEILPSVAEIAGAAEAISKLFI